MEGVAALSLFWSHLALLGGAAGLAFVLGMKTSL